MNRAIEDTKWWVNKWNPHTRWFFQLDHRPICDQICAFWTILCLHSAHVSYFQKKQECVVGGSARQQCNTAKCDKAVATFEKGSVYFSDLASPQMHASVLFSMKQAILASNCGLLNKMPLIWAQDSPAGQIYSWCPYPHNIEYTVNIKMSASWHLAWPALTKYFWKHSAHTKDL